MYLSKLVLNPRCKQALKEADDPYQMHRTLAKAFGPNLTAARVLFRVDWPMEGGPHVIVQSIEKPDWTALPADYAQASSRPFSLDLHAGQRLVFRLLAHPTKRDKLSGKRVTLRSEAERAAWIARKGEASGFQIIAFRILDGRWRNSKATRLSGPVAAVRFDGILRVTDPEKLREAVRNGIGTQKAFGFGLLSLARP